MKHYDVKNDLEFAAVVRQHENRIYYYIHKLGIRDDHDDFYAEGLVAMWRAWRSYDSSKGAFTTYLNYTIRHRLLDMLRKESMMADRGASVVQEEMLRQHDGVYTGMNRKPMVQSSAAFITIDDVAHWHAIQAILSDNQWRWVQHYIIEDMPIKEIAQLENVSIHAVKSWGREVRKKLRAHANQGLIQQVCCYQKGGQHHVYQA